MEIRHLRQLDDRIAISRIYEESWKFSYQGIVPQDYLDRIPVGHWAAHLDNDEMNTLVLVERGKLIGTSSYCKSRFSDFAGYGEIVSLYLLPEYIGMRYGKRLLESVIAELGGMGYREIFLWVLKDNLRARTFYEKAGFLLSDGFLDDNIGGKELREIPYCFHLQSKQ